VTGFLAITEMGITLGLLGFNRLRPGLLCPPSGFALSGFALRVCSGFALLKVSSVASDLFGVSGRRMLAAIAEGRRDAGWMADYARGTLRNKKPELERALDGSFTAHQRWMLREELGHLASLEAQIERVREEIERQTKPQAEQLRRLTTIPGIDQITAWTLLAELGPDMSVFPDADHCASWAGMCPGNRMTGGKRLSGRTRKANPYLRRDLCQAAWAASHTKGTYLEALYRRFRARLGHNKAVFALAHQMLLTAYTMLRRGEDYRELGADYFDREDKPRVVKRLLKRLTSLGYAVTLQESVGLAVSELPQSVTASGAGVATAPATPAQAVPVPAVPIAGDSASPILSIHPSQLPPAILKRLPGRPCKCALKGIPCHHKNSSAKARPNYSSA